jgi:hypothetical protein
MTSCVGLSANSIGDIGKNRVPMEQQSRDRAALLCAFQESKTPPTH